MQTSKPRFDIKDVQQVVVHNPAGQGALETYFTAFEWDDDSNIYKQVYRDSLMGKWSTEDILKKLNTNDDPAKAD